MSAQALERQIREVYDALDTGSSKSAVVSCNKLLKKYPKNDLIKALKALALARIQRVDEALVLCDEVLATKATDDSVLSAMTHVLRTLGRHSDLITMFDNAFKRQPNNEDLGCQTFLSAARDSNWKVAQQVAVRMHKQFQEDRYIYWAVIGAILQANDSATPPDMRTLLFKLAHRHVTSSPSPSYSNAERFYLHLMIVKELRLFDEAHKLLDSEVGKSICSASLACDEIRRDIWRLRGLWKDEGERAQSRIVEKHDRNWLEFSSVLDAAFSDLGGCKDAELDAAKAECSEMVQRTRSFLNEVMQNDVRLKGTALLALLELERRCKKNGIMSNDPDLVDCMTKYFHFTGNKACCFEDLKPYLDLSGDDFSRWTSFLELQDLSFDNVDDLLRTINVYKFLRYHLPQSEFTLHLELKRAKEYVECYLEGLQFGSGLPVTELQPVDDLAIMAGQSLVSLWKMNDDEVYLFNAVSLLEFALTKSRVSSQMHLMLIRLYRLLGAPSLGLEHYRALQIKQIQTDTMSHFIISRALTFSLAASGDLTYPTECIEASQIYLHNAQETPEFILRAFTSEKYSQIQDFLIFEDKLENSLQRDIIKIEHVRMRMTHELFNVDNFDVELIELKLLYDRVHHDNRDFDILSNYQPQCQPSFERDTILLGKSAGAGWLSIYLKIYIRAFQQASDLDDTVEDKLLIGDRPKKKTTLPIRERVLERTLEELADLTADELSFLDWFTALSDWLEPYHNHARPPPAAVLAEAAKQSELKTGYPLKGIDLLPQNGSHTNGHAKKDDESPAVKALPEEVVKFFDEMFARFQDTLKKERLPEILHAATLTQEAFILFYVVTLRFRTPSVVKIHKLGALVQSFKDVRTRATSVLKDMSSALIKMGEQASTMESRATFIEACKLVTMSSKIDHDFVLNVAKKVGDSRKRVLEGVGKGIMKVISSYS